MKSIFYYTSAWIILEHVQEPTTPKMPKLYSPRGQLLTPTPIIGPFNRNFMGFTSVACMYPGRSAPKPERGAEQVEKIIRCTWHLNFIIERFICSLLLQLLSILITKFLFHYLNSIPEILDIFIKLVFSCELIQESP